VPAGTKVSISHCEGLEAGEHIVEDIKVVAADIVAGVGFTIYALSPGPLKTPDLSPLSLLGPSSGTGQAFGKGQPDRGLNAPVPGRAAVLTGKWSVGWFYTQQKAHRIQQRPFSRMFFQTTDRPLNVTNRSFKRSHYLFHVHSTISSVSQADAAILPVLGWKSTTILPGGSLKWCKHAGYTNIKSM
jgi:hypothetical protein